MRIDGFHRERTECVYDKRVRPHLSEGGVQPLGFEELLAEHSTGRFPSRPLRSRLRHRARR